MSEKVEKISQELADIINQSADLEIGEAQGAASPGQQVIARVNNRLVTRTATTNVVAGQSVAVGGDAVAGAETGIVEENRREDRWEEEPREPRPGVPEKPPFRLPILFAAAIESESSEDVNLDCKCYSWNYDPQYAENGREDSWKEECIPNRAHPDRPAHGVSRPPTFRWAAYIDRESGNQVFPGVPFPYSAKPLTPGYWAHSLSNDPVPSNPVGWGFRIFGGIEYGALLIPGWATTEIHGRAKLGGTALPLEYYNINYSGIEFHNPDLYEAKLANPSAISFYKEGAEYIPVYSSPTTKRIRVQPYIWNNRYIVISNSDPVSSQAWRSITSQELYPYFSFRQSYSWIEDGRSFTSDYRRFVRLSDNPLLWQLIESSIFPSTAPNPGISTPREPTPTENGKPLVIKFYLGGTTKEPFELPVKIRSDDAFNGGIALIEHPEKLQVLVCLKLGICSAFPLDEEAYDYSVRHDADYISVELAKTFVEYQQAQTQEAQDEYIARLIDWYQHCSEINIFTLELIPPDEDDEDDEPSWKLLSHDVFNFPEYPDVPHWSNRVTGYNQENTPFRTFAFLNDYRHTGGYASFQSGNYFNLLTYYEDTINLLGISYWGGCDIQILSAIVKMNFTMITHGKPNDADFAGFNRNSWYSAVEFTPINIASQSIYNIVDSSYLGVGPGDDITNPITFLFQEDCNYKTTEGNPSEASIWWMPLYQQNINQLNEDNDFLFNVPVSARVYQLLCSNYFGQAIKSSGEDNPLEQQPIKFELFEFVLTSKDYGFLERNIQSCEKFVNPLNYDPSKEYCRVRNQRVKGPYIAPLLNTEGERDGDPVQSVSNVIDAIRVSPLHKIFLFSQPGWTRSGVIEYPSEEYQQNVEALIDEYRQPDFVDAELDDRSYQGRLNTLEATVKGCLSKKVYTVEAWPIKQPNFRTVLILGTAVPTDKTLKNL